MLQVEGVNYPPPQQYVRFCASYIETRFQRFSFAYFPAYPHQPCLALPTLVNTKWRTETGSSLKRRDINVASAAMTQFSGLLDPLPPVPTSSDVGEQHQVQTGSKKSTPHRKY